VVTEERPDRPWRGGGAIDCWTRKTWWVHIRVLFGVSLVLKEVGSGHRKGDGGFDIFLAFSMKRGSEF